MLRINFPEESPAWAKGGASATFRFSYLATQFDYEMRFEGVSDQIASIALSGLRDGTRFQTDVQKALAASSQGVTVEVFTAADQARAKFKLSKDELGRLVDDACVEIELRAGVDVDSFQFSKPDDVEAKFDTDAGRLVFPILKGGTRTDLKRWLEANLEVTLECSYSLNSGLIGENTTQTQSFKVFPAAGVNLVSSAMTDTAFKPLGETTNSDSECIIGFSYDLSATHQGSGLLSELLKTGVSDNNKSNWNAITARRLIIKFRQDRATSIYGRPYADCASIEFDFAESINRIYRVASIVGSGKRRSVVQYAYVEARDQSDQSSDRGDVAQQQPVTQLRLILPFTSNAEAQRYSENDYQIDVVSVATSQAISTGPEVEFRGNVTTDAIVRMKIKKYVNDALSVCVICSVHRFVDRQMTVVLDMGSFSWFGGLHIKKAGSADPEEPLILSIGPKMEEADIDDNEGPAEILYRTVDQDHHRTDHSSQPNRLAYWQRCFGPEIEGSKFDIHVGDANDAPGVGSPSDPSRGQFLPFFKSALFRGSSQIRVPDGHGNAVLIETGDIFFDVFRNIFADMLDNDEAVKKIREVTEEALNIANQRHQGVPKQQETEKELVLGVVLTHPGFVTFETHRLITQTVKTVLRNFHKAEKAREEFKLRGDPDEHIALVRGLPEPVAVAAGSLKSADEGRNVAYIDIGRRTLDIAVFKPEEMRHRLIECAGSDLGGQRLDYALVEGLSELYSAHTNTTKLGTQSAVTFRNVIPLTDSVVENAFIGQKCDLSRKHYERFQSILRTIERFKRSVEPNVQGDQKIPIKIADIDGRESPSDLFDLEMTKQLLRYAKGDNFFCWADGNGVYLEIGVSSLSETTSLRRYRNAVLAFCKSYLADYEGHEMVVRLCGRGSQTPFLKDLEDWLESVDFAVEKLSGYQSKNQTVTGAIALLKNPDLLLTDKVKQRLSVLCLDANYKLLSAKDARQVSGHFCVDQDAAFLVVAPICSKVADHVAEEIQGEASEEEVDWWYEALFIDLKDKNQLFEVTPGQQVAIKKEEQQLGHDETAIAARNQGRDVEDWTVSTSDGGPRQKTWRFISHGALNQ